MAKKRGINIAVMICLVLFWKNTLSEGSSSVHSENVKHACSEYHFDTRYFSWEMAKQYCKNQKYDGLVSMQTEGEWEYFKNITTNITAEQGRALEKKRWFIGLRYFSHKWCWSNLKKACINETTDETGKWRWYAGEPNNLNTEHCVEMLQGGKYNNTECTKEFEYIGFICEKNVACSNVSRKYFFRNPKTTDTPFTTENKRQSSVAKQSIFFTESTIQPYQSTDGGRGDRQESHEVDNIEREPSVPRQTSYDETYFLPNATSSSLPDEITIEGPHLYAVIDKTGNKNGHSSSNMPCQTMPHSDEHVVTLCPTLEPLLKAKEHIYVNTTQEDSKRKPPLYPTPYCARYNRPQEHPDDRDGKKEYVYAVVDKTRAKKTKDETCGLVYTELELKPTQDEDETEVTAKGCVTIYSSIQEQQ